MQYSMLESFIKSGNYADFAAECQTIVNFDESLSQLLFVAISHMLPRFIEEILECGGITTITNSDGKTPAAFAAVLFETDKSEDLEEVIELLKFVKPVPYIFRCADGGGKIVFNGKVLQF